MNKDKLGFLYVTKLMIFDEDGKFITKLDTLKHNVLKHKESGEVFILVKDALLDTKLLEFINKSEKNVENDFESYVYRNKPKSIKFNYKHKSRKCKLVANGTSENLENKNIKYDIICPNAYMLNSIDVVLDGTNPSEFDIVFKINAYNDEGDVYELVIYN